MKRKSDWTNLDGYKAVIDRANAIHKKRTGLDRGGAVWLARELGISRQLLHNHGKYKGFPPHLIEPLSKITGLAPDVIRPDAKPTVIPESYFTAIKRLALNQGMTVYDLLSKAGWFSDKNRKEAK